MDNTSLKVTSTNLSLRTKRKPIIAMNIHANFRSGLLRRPVTNQKTKILTAMRMSTIPITNVIKVTLTRTSSTGNDVLRNGMLAPPALLWILFFAESCPHFSSGGHYCVNGRAELHAVVAGIRRKQFRGSVCRARSAAHQSRLFRRVAARSRLQIGPSLLGWSVQRNPVLTQSNGRWQMPLPPPGRQSMRSGIRCESSACR
jgi:hypothetical protein